MTATYAAIGDSFFTTDSSERGCGFLDLAELTADLTRALNGAILSFMLRAELEDAFDTALFRESIAETPQFIGGSLFAIS